MSRSVLFKTDTVLDLRAITTFGVNSKPNSANPIGYFGTGLKYAIAVLLRHKQEVVFHIGRKTYTFFTKEEEFRNKSFPFVYMRQERSYNTGFIAKTMRLPFTLELGKNWEPWMAFRELYSNTIDEHGQVYGNNLDDVGQDMIDMIAFQYTPEAKTTKIVVTGDEFYSEWCAKDQHFLPGGERKVFDDGDVQVFDQPTKYLYYRGMRVFDLDRKARFTYNILKPMQLTEDRTLKDRFWADHAIATYMATEAPESFVVEAFKADERSYEARLEYQYVANEPSENFVSAARSIGIYSSPTTPVSNPTIRKYLEEKDSNLKEQLSKKQDLPKKGTYWRHHKGYLYKVIMIANRAAGKEKQYKFPLTVVYKDMETGRVWARLFSEWHKSFKIADAAESNYVDPDQLDF